MDKMKMAHEYIVACLRSGKKLDDINIHVAYKMAIDLEKTHKSNENKSRPDVLSDEWQPDWSQAPDGAKYWTKTTVGNYLWCANEPTSTEDYFSSHGDAQQAPSFGYLGNWRDSLRKRP